MIITAEEALDRIDSSKRGQIAIDYIIAGINCLVNNPMPKTTGKELGEIIRNTARMDGNNLDEFLAWFD